MGKTPKPLTIAVHPQLQDMPEIQELVDKGHTIAVLTQEEGQYDMILGPNCWRMTPELVKYLSIAIKEARAKRYPGNKGGKDEQP